MIRLNHNPFARDSGGNRSFGYPTEEARQYFLAKNIPAGRFGEPDELAVLATFLCSPLAGYATGTVRRDEPIRLLALPRP